MVYVIKISSFLPLFTDKPTTWSWERNRAKPSDGFLRKDVKLFERSDKRSSLDY